MKLNKIKTALSSLGDILRGKHLENGNEPLIPKPLTNQELENKVFEVYKKRFEDSTEFSMVYPTCFRIYLHSTDFKARQDAFPIIARDLQKYFCRYNRQNMSKYEDNKPTSPCWLFQFVEFKEGTLIGETESMQQGEVNTITTLYSERFSTEVSNIGNESGVTLTKNPKNSLQTQERNNVNLNAFLEMDMEDGNRFRIKINENYEEVTATPKSEDKTQITETDTIAYLICDKNFIARQNRGNKYNITTNYLFLSGKNDMRQGNLYAKVDYSLPNDIVQIKHENGSFFVAAFGKVRLNGGLLPKSEGIPLWQPLANNSKMLIEDEVSIEFKIK
jgi:hypothetical protein